MLMHPTQGRVKFEEGTTVNLRESGATKGEVKFSESSVLNTVEDWSKTKSLV